jgi:hypothetical protein
MPVRLSAVTPVKSALRGRGRERGGGAARWCGLIGVLRKLLRPAPLRAVRLDRSFAPPASNRDRVGRLEILPLQFAADSADQPITKLVGTGQPDSHRFNEGRSRLGPQRMGSRHQDGKLSIAQTKQRPREPVWLGRRWWWWRPQRHWLTLSDNRGVDRGGEGMIPLFRGL